MSRFILAACASISLAAMPAYGQHGGQAQSQPTSNNPYAPYDWLVGDWVSQPGPNQTLRQQVRYGPNKSYLSYSTYIGRVGQPEALHFEGIGVWNGQTRVVDYLFAVEPGSGVQEKGIIHADPDGSIVREVDFTDANGRSATFRQRFWKDESGTVATSLMRKTDKGWEPNFPGSDRIVMTRRV